MMNLEIIKVRLKGIKGNILAYTNEPSIKEIIIATEDALLQKNFDMMLFGFKEISEWYKNNINSILGNNFVYDEEQHKKNMTLIQEIVSELTDNEDEFKKTYPKLTKLDEKISNEESIVNIFEKFHIMTNQLRDRYDDRESLDVSDEYDVQDFLHVLLKLYCEDIRPEEWTPSCAGSCSRQDFLLKNEKIVIEVKKTRKGLGNKELAEQLIIDIERYKKHPDCKKLICFVYDPENRIRNPRGFENDLLKNENDFAVQVYIRP